MADFTSTIIAKLDRSQFDADMASIRNAKYTVKIQLDSQVMQQINSIKNALSGLGNTPISIGNNINTNNFRSTINNLKNQGNIAIQQLQSALSGMNFDSASISKITTIARGKGLVITISGFDQLGRSIKLVQELDAITGDFYERYRQIGQHFMQPIQADGVKNYTAQFKEMMSVLNQANSLEVRIRGLDSNANANQVAELTQQLVALRTEFNNLSAQNLGNLSPQQVDAIATATERTKDKLAELEAKLQDTRARIAETFTAKLDNGAIGADIAKVSADFDRFRSSGHSSLTQVEADLNELRNIQNQLANTSRSDINTIVSLWERYQTTLTRAKNSMNTVKADVGGMVNTTQISGLDNKISSWSEKNSRALKQFGATIDEIRKKLSAMAQAGGAPKGEFDALKTQFTQIQAAASNAGMLGKTWSDQFKTTLGGLTRYFSGYYLIFQAIRGLKEMYSAVKEIDSAMVQLRRITNETATTYDAFLRGASETAKEIGTSVSDYINSVADFARVGYSFEDAQQMAQAANVYAMVGNISTVDAATTSLISTLKAFNVSAEDALSVVDKFDNIGNKFAISSEGIGEALMRSASSLAAAGNDIDQSIALVTAANTVVQNPESVGNAFKTNHCLYV